MKAVDTNPRSRIALITGASSGMGEAFARLLAREGCDLVLTARREERLNALARLCADEYGVRVFVHAADLSEENAAEHLYRFLDEHSLSVDVLINNAGYSVFSAFAKADITRVTAMMRLHMLFVVSLTRYLLPGMLARGRGHILNVSSVYAMIPVPYQSVYAATKAFLHSYSLALNIETASRGVMVSVLCPGTTATEFRDAVPGLGSAHAGGMASERVVRIAWKSMNRGQVIIIPGIVNKIYYLLAKFLPSSLVARVALRMNQGRGVNVRD